MSRFMELFKRDFTNCINKRFFLLLGFMILFQAWFILGSGSVNKVSEAGRIDFMAVVFSFNFFGSLAALALTFDGISKERQNKVLDMILTSGVTKRQIMLSKTASNLAVSFLFSALYVLVIAVIYAVASRNFSLALLCLRYVPALTAFNFIYCMLGLMLSILFRSSKTSFIVSMILGLLFMPRLLVSLLEGVANAFHLGEEFIQLAGMASPALIMNAIGDPSQGQYLLAGIGFFALYAAGMIACGMIIFQKQDELNYGE